MCPSFYFSLRGEKKVSRKFNQASNKSNVKNSPIMMNEGNFFFKVFYKIKLNKKMINFLDSKEQCFF